MIQGAGWRALPSGWVQTTLGEMSEIILGQSPPSSTYNSDGNGLPFYQGKLEFGELYPTPRKWCSEPKKIAEQGDILLSVRAPVGPTNICPERSCIGRGLAALRGSDGIESRFILYLLRSFERDLARLATGTTFGAITGRTLSQFPVPLAPSAEQRRIVAKIEELFTKLDAGVGALKKAKGLLKRYRQSVLKAAFEGKLTGNYHIDPDSKRHERMEHTPASWKHMQVSDIVERVQYGTSVKANGDPSGIAVLRMGNIQEGELSFEDLKYLPRSVPDLQKYMTADGDVLFNRTNSAELVGKSAVYREHHPKAAFASYLIRLTVDRDLCNPDFLSFYINSCHGRGYIRSVQSQQVGQANVNASKLRAMPIPVPPLDEQEAIVEEIQRRLSVADALESTTERTLSQAGALRQSVLKRAFEGRLVSQCSDDEQAERLLDRIRSSKWGGVA